MLDIHKRLIINQEYLLHCKLWKGTEFTFSYHWQYYYFLRQYVMSLFISFLNAWWQLRFTSLHLILNSIIGLNYQYLYISYGIQVSISLSDTLENISWRDYFLAIFGRKTMWVGEGFMCHWIQYFSIWLFKFVLIE